MALIDNLISYWKLDGNSTDAVGSNNGTDTSITYSGANGKINEGAGFNGSSSVITKSSPTGFPTGVGARTVSLWFKAPSLSATTHALVDITNNLSGTSAWDTRWSVSLNGTTSIYVDIGNGNVAITVPTMSTNTWYHLVTVYPGSGNVWIGYLNGVQYTSSAFPRSPLKLTPDVFEIGRNYQSVYGDSLIDEVGIWSRALSGAEITSLYNGGAGLQYPFITTNIKTIQGLTYASVKTVQGLAVASIKIIQGLN